MTHRSRLIMALLAVTVVAALPSRTEAQVANWQKGVTLTAWWYNTYSSSTAMTRLDELKAMNCNWVTILPTWFVSNGSSNTVYEDVNGASPSEASLRTCIQQIHARGMKVMLKLHVDSKDGTWRGGLRPSSPSAWFSSHQNFIVKMATLAAATGVDQLCIATEMRSLSGSAYTNYWRTAIAAARKVYNGPMTYAANWDEYKNVQWWDALDYIGIDTYMPLVNSAYPTVEQVRAGWYSMTDPWGTARRYVDEIKAVSVKFGKKVIFTEAGFKDVASACNEWGSGINTTQSYQSQVNAYEGTFRAWDTQPWMIGVHWWDLRVQGGTYSRDHPINGKPVIGTIKAWYGKSGSGGSTDTTAPATPSGLTATPSGTSAVALKWNTSTDNVGVTGYNVFRNGTKVATVTGTTHTDSGLSAATAYTYRVSAFDAAGNQSAQSTAVSATTATPGDASAPSVPTGLTATATSPTQIAVKWNASTDNVGVAGYHVYRNGVKLTTVNGTAHTDSGLMANTTYSYRVAAFDAAGNTSAQCAAVTGTTAGADSTAAYGFETGTQSWTNRARATGVTADTSVKYAGNASLGIQLSGISNGSGMQGQAEVVPPTTLVAGKTVTMQVYLGASATNVVACGYAQDKNWRWSQGATVALKANTWTPISITVPSTAVAPLNRLGLLLFTSGGSFTGKVCLDEVRWDGATTPPLPPPPPPPAPEPSDAQFGFDAGTQGWVNRARATGVSQDTSVKYAGAGSLAVNLSGISYTSGTQGQAEVVPPTALVAGKTVTMQVYLGSSATNVRACAYSQDRNWRWSQGAIVALKPNGWAQISITVPSTAVAPLNRLGVLLFTSGGSFTGKVCVDEVRW